MKYRSRTEIVEMILNSANGRATKTKIMYKAFLNYHQLKEYLAVLIENNLIEYLNGTLTFRTTEKGLEFLRMHSEIGELLHITAKTISSRLGYDAGRAAPTDLGLNLFICTSFSDGCNGKIEAGTEQDAK